MKERIIRWIRRKVFKDLREICRQKYGDSFVKEYDQLGAGIPIGGYEYTIAFVKAVEKARKEAGYGKWLERRRADNG